VIALLIARTSLPDPMKVRGPPNPKVVSSCNNFRGNRGFDLVQ